MVYCSLGHFVELAAKQCKNTLCRGAVVILGLGLLAWTGANSSETVEKLELVTQNQHGIKEGVLKLEQTINAVGLRVAENTAKNAEQDERLKRLEEKNDDQDKKLQELEKRQEEAQPMPQAVPLST